MWSMEIFMDFHRCYDFASLCVKSDYWAILISYDRMSETIESGVWYCACDILFTNNELNQNWEKRGINSGILETAI